MRKLKLRYVLTCLRSQGWEERAGVPSRKLQEGKLSRAGKGCSRK